jgi:hypothetical protein
VAGAPAKLNLKNELLAISSSNDTRINAHIEYLAKAVVFRYEHFPDHSIIEAFKIIEDEKVFIRTQKPFFEKFNALRNILAHSPKYSDKTIIAFKTYFSKNTFDYRVYDPENNTIILDLHSNKTLRELNRLLKEVMDGVKKYLKVE